MWMRKSGSFGEPIICCCPKQSFVGQTRGEVYGASWDSGPCAAMLEPFPLSDPARMRVAALFRLNI